MGTIGAILVAADWEADCVVGPSDAMAQATMPMVAANETKVNMRIERMTLWTRNLIGSVPLPPHGTIEPERELRKSRISVFVKQSVEF